MTERYAELHARSAFSFLHGACHPQDLARTAGELGLEAVALCDRNGLSGAVRFHQAARDAGIQPIIGAELVMEDDAVLPVLVQTRTGYQGLCRLLTTVLLRAPKGEGRVAWSELEGKTEGLIALSGDEEGPLLRGWSRRGRAGAAEALARLLSAFPRDAVQIEVQRHRHREETGRIQFLRDLAMAERLPLLATNGVCYARPESRRVQDVFTCLRHHTHLDAAGRLLAANAERHLKPASDMVDLFADMPEAITQTLRVAESITFSLQDLGYRFPDYPVPEGETMGSFLEKITWFGAEQRYGSLTPPVRRQLRRELDLIHQLGFDGYFLIVWEMINFCRQECILVQGRGSAANSAVCYSLGITACDPVGGNLLFERFLSEGRSSWPDIDLDLPSGDRRERVIQEVYRRYGPRGAAMTANVITYRKRNTAREIGKVLQLPEDVVGRFCSLFQSGDYPHTLELREHMKRAGLPSAHPRGAAFACLYQQIHGLPRHLGQHSGGMIICRGRLDSVVPLENASMPGRIVAQWDKDDCEDMGIIKVDLLGLGMMAALQDAVTLTGERGHPVDLAKIPKDDPATYALLRAADTVGVFQVESRAQMATLPRLKPEKFYDLVIEVAIVRPGPIVGRLAHPYLERRAGREPITYLHESVRPVLERTLGVPLFQEQVLKMAMILADFSGDKAEALRRALGFHRSEERVRRVQQQLCQALRERGHTPELVEEMLSVIESFALYGFPESHAVSFGLLAYASAFLKVHHPAEFFAGLLNNQPLGFYSSSTLIQDARRRGLRFLPPCILHSDRQCTVVDDNTLRLGLSSVRGMNTVSISRILETRSGRPFESLRDFLRRTTLPEDERRILASTGTLNALCGDRRKALWMVQEALPQGDLFDHPEADLRGAPPPDQETPLSPMTPLERLEADYQGIGLTVGKHPMAYIRSELPPSILTAAALADVPPGKKVTVAGAVICRQRPGTAKGVVFISLEDETGIANCVVYAKLFERFRLPITQEPFLRISGPIQSQDNVIHVIARKIEALIHPRLPSGASHDFH